MISIYSFVWTLINCGIVACLILFLRKRTVFMEKYGIKPLIILSMVCIVRMLLPFEFPGYQYSIDDPYVYVVIASLVKNLNLSNKALYIICVIWMIGIVIKFIEFYRNQKNISHILKEFAVPDEESQKILLSKVDSFCKVSVYRTSAAPVPLIVGLKNPVIYIPIEPYTDKEIEYILLHEYTHYQRKDLWKKLIINLLCAIIWWNPVIYLIRDEVTKLLEFNCDKELSKKLNDLEVMEYLETLYNVVKSNNKLSKSFMLYTIEFVSKKDKYVIEQRFDLLLNRENHKESKIRSGFFLLIMIIWVACSYYFLWQPKYNAPSGELLDYPTTVIAGDDNAYLEEQEDGNYLFYFGEHVEEISKEEVQEGTYKGYPIIKYENICTKWRKIIFNQIESFLNNF